MSEGGFFKNLEEVSNFYKKQTEEDEEFSQYGEGGAVSLYIYNNAKRHFVPAEDDSIVKQMRGY